MLTLPAQVSHLSPPTPPRLSISPRVGCPQPAREPTLWGACVLGSVLGPPLPRSTSQMAK